MIRPAYLDGPTWEQFVTARPPVCADTGPHWGPMTIDHIVPRARGGTHDLSNLQWLCLGCNVRKGINEDKHWRETTWFDQPVSLTACRGSQHKIYDAIVTHPEVFGRPISLNSGTLWLNCWMTGSGKTIGMAVAALALNAVLRATCGTAAPRGRRMLVVTKEQPIRDQLAQELRRDLVRFGLVERGPKVKVAQGADDLALRNLETADIWVVCVQTLWERGRAGLSAIEVSERLNAFEFIHLDEPHWAFPQEFQRIVSLAHRAIVMGWTATPVGPNGELLTGAILLTEYTYRESAEHDGAVKYLGDLDGILTEVDIEEYERYLAGVRATRHSVADEVGYDLNWRPVVTVAQAVVRRLAELDHVVIGGPAAPHRPAGVRTDLLYPAHAMIRVMSIAIGRRLERYLNELFRKNPQQFDPQRGWKAACVHSQTLLYGAEEETPERIAGQPLSPQHPWFVWKESHGVKIGVRILIVIGMGREGISNPPNAVIGLATSTGSARDQAQFSIGRPIRAVVQRDGEVMRVPPAPLDRVHIISHPAYASRPSIEAALRYALDMSAYLEALPTIEVLADTTARITPPDAPSVRLPIVDQLRLFIAVQTQRKAGVQPDPIEIVERICGPAPEARKRLARVLVEDIVRNPRGTRDRIVPPPATLDQLEAQVVILRELPRDVAPDDPALVAWLDREAPDLGVLVRQAPPDVWRDFLRAFVLDKYDAYIQATYRPVVALTDDEETIEGIRRGYAADALAEFWPVGDAPSETRKMAHLFVGKAVKDLLGQDESVQQDGPFDTIEVRTVLRQPDVARKIRDYVRRKLVHGGYVPALKF